MLIVDTAAGICESVLQFCQSAQQVLVVLRDEPAALTDTYALIKVLSRERGVRQFRVLANMTRERGQGETAVSPPAACDRSLSGRGLDYVGEIPEDLVAPEGRAVTARGDRAVPVCPAAQAFSPGARRESLAAADGPSGRLEFFFERMLVRPAPRLQVLK